MVSFGTIEFLGRPFEPVEHEKPDELRLGKPFLLALSLANVGIELLQLPIGICAFGFGRAKGIVDSGGKHPASGVVNEVRAIVTIALVHQELSIFGKRPAIATASGVFLAILNPRLDFQLNDNGTDVHISSVLFTLVPRIVVGLELIWVDVLSVLVLCHCRPSFSFSIFE